MVLFFVFLFMNVDAGIPKWYDDYKAGLSSMEAGDWNAAAEYFLSALEVKDKDKGKTRAYGTVLIKYFANRELGICYYRLGQAELAEKYLRKSIRQSKTKRARNYLSRIKSGNIPTPTKQIVTTKTKDKLFSLSEKQPKKPVQASNYTETSKVGERLSIAVLPFESKGLGDDIGNMDLLDKLITGFVNSKRFKVIERAQLDKILAEHKLGMSGILDASTAAEIGKGIGVDAVVVGSVTRSGNSVSVDARLIDTESAAIIAAKDAYTNNISFQNISLMILDLGEKIKKELPIVNGFVINVQGDKLTLDIGLNKGVKKGMKCTVYREGEAIIHPGTGKVLGKMINEICEVQIIDVFDGYSLSRITRSMKGTPKNMDKIVTK